MKTGLACLAVLAAAASIAGSAPRAHGSPILVEQQSTTKPVVPLSVQHLLRRRAPRAAYVPHRLPPGYSYATRENLNPRGFDLYFSCCDDNLPLLGFDALLPKRSEPCNQGIASKVFRLDGVLVSWNTGHNNQEAWRCIRRGGTRLLLTVSGTTRGAEWRTPRQLARMVASARPIG